MKSEDSEHIEIKNIIRARWNEHCIKYDRHGYHSEERKEAWKSLLSQALGTETEKLDVLDVGCGTGMVTLPLAELGHNVTGVDLSEGMLKIAKDKKRPEADVEILENLGFSVDVMDVPIPIFPRTRTFMGFLKYGHWGGRGSFLVRARTKENNG